MTEGAGTPMLDIDISPAGKCPAVIIMTGSTFVIWYSTVLTQIDSRRIGYIMDMGVAIKVSAVAVCTFTAGAAVYSRIAVGARYTGAVGRAVAVRAGIGMQHCDNSTRMAVHTVLIIARRS
jgi:hypothetical protein